RRNEGHLKPPAVLIRTFQIHVGGVGKRRPLFGVFENRRPRNTRLKPNVKNIGVTLTRPSATLSPGERGWGGGGLPSPQSLSGQTPIGTRFHHSRNAVTPELGIKFHLLQLFQKPVAKTFFIDIEKPLFGGTKDDGFMTTPAMGIGMRDLARIK